MCRKASGFDPRLPHHDEGQTAAPEPWKKNAAWMPVERAANARLPYDGHRMTRRHSPSTPGNLRRALIARRRNIALVILGVLASACSDGPTMTATPVTAATPTAAVTLIRPLLTTHLYALDSESVRLEDFDGSGGAIESMGDDLLVVTPKGRFALVFRDGTVEYLDGSVPMNYTGLESSPMSEEPDFDSFGFRVADILLKEIVGGYTLFVTHHHFAGECAWLRLSSTTLAKDGQRVAVLPDWRTIFDAEPCSEQPNGWHSSGGKILTDGEEHLLVTIGNHLYGQRPIPSDLHIGKFVRIEIETGEAETLATGIRNSQGLARDAEGNLWATDHGPTGGDELNLLREGVDYGWPHVSYGVGYGRVALRLTEDEDIGWHDGFRRPAFAWVPSPVLSAIAVNDERLFPLWKDDLLIASLDGQSIFRVRRHGTDVQYVERIEVGYPIRDITLMPDGRIALLSDGSRVTFLSHSARYCDEEARNRRDVYSINCESLAASPWPAAPSGSGNLGRDTAAGAQLFGQHCSACHDLNAERHGPGPHLVDVMWRRAGKVGGYRFSAAFDALDAVWTRDSITRFLTDPEQFAPGTSMSSPGIDETEARAIADYISSLDYLERLTEDSQPALRSDFDVYLSENTLTYVKEPCAPADTEARFFLHLIPVDVNDLPDQRKQHSFDNLDFDFDVRGVIFDGKCLAVVPLPEYDVAAIITGQFVPRQEPIWEGDIRP